MGMHKKASDTNLKNSAHVDRHEEQLAMPEAGSAVGSHKMKVKTGGMSAKKEAEYKADVLPTAYHQGPTDGITSHTQSIPAMRHGGKPNAIKSQ